jgi:DNA-binding NarL/FixJ family response regulator
MRKKNSRIEVLIVSSISTVREGIIEALSGDPEIKVKGQVSSVLELMGCVSRLNPSIVIVKDDDKGICSLEAINLINQGATGVKILLLIKDYNEDRELAALKMGVKGFLPESVGRGDFIRCIKAINRGEMWVRRRVMERLIQQLLAINPPKRDDHIRSSSRGV